MAILPLRPYLKHYSGSQENPRRKTAEYNEMAIRVVEHVNALIANNADENQQYMFAEIAIDLGLTADQVRSAISYGGHNGITIHVTEEDRVALARYKSKSS
jgi:hypothetical protein